MGLPHTPGNTDELCPVTHHHAPGLYAREIFIPAGVLIVGKIHKHSHVNTISKGRVIVATEFGTQELVAPVTFVSVPGTKRAVVAQEDTIWTTYHPTEETDLAKIEEEVIAPDFLAYEQWRLS
jgi:quercetin dioxygenase-like cupin family protein